MKTVILSEPIGQIMALIMTICEGHATHDRVERLRQKSLEHGPDCALGSAPACTCGKTEAENFVGLFHGTLRGIDLVK
jgi:hypothetical protein